jgi:hypothetical protein
MGVSDHCPSEIREAFRFLIDEFGYRIERDEVLFHGRRPYGYVLEYSGNDRRVHLVHDYRDNFFDFTVIRGLDTTYPNDSDLENIVLFLKVFRSFDPSLDPGVIQPRSKTCGEAAQLNARLLKEYAADILRGNKWI